MMSRMLGAPFGGTMRGGHHGLESLALSLITPPKGIGGGGICFPSIVTVASGEPGVPLICWVQAQGATDMTAATSIPQRKVCLVDFIGINLFVFAHTSQSSPATCRASRDLRIGLSGYTRCSITPDTAASTTVVAR